MTENKFSKYLLYAIGEIILVVIGILIALQINNWNEVTKQIKEEEEILVSLKEELKNNITTLNASIKVNKGYRNHTNHFIDSIRNNSSSFSTSSFNLCFNYRPPQLNTFVLEDILKSDRKLKTKKKEFTSALRRLTSLHSGIKKNEFYLDESWNSKSSEFLINTGLNFRNFNFTNNRITLKDLEKGGYTNIQVISLLALYDQLRSEWIGSQVRTLKACEGVLEILKINSK
ncbi:MAG: hypothetical protein KJO64_00610 [Bacteroidia bacterium]|nr:hypothetical protein [Bacteroidia bacterium]